MAAVMMAICSLYSLRSNSILGRRSISGKDDGYVFARWLPLFELFFGLDVNKLAMVAGVG